LVLLGTSGARGRASAEGSISLNGYGTSWVAASASGHIELNGIVILKPPPVLIHPIARIRPNTARGRIRPNAQGYIRRNTAYGRIRT
jgi:hypothetical protein